MVSNDWLMFLLGAVTFIVVSHQIPILRNLSESNSNIKVKQLRIEDIQGIDLNSLQIARQKDLI